LKREVNNQDIVNNHIINQSELPTSPINEHATKTIEQVYTNGSFKLSQTRVQGHSHKKATPPIPCQDNGKAGILSNDYHVLLVSDGAGSSKLSHVASEFCVNTLYSYLQVVDFKDFQNKPSEIEQTKEKWHDIVKGLFEKLRSKLIEFADENTISHEDLLCTLVMVIKTDWGFLSANIGDGRSGYSDGNPKALSVPFMTYTVGATFFLIKEDWENMFRSYVTMVDRPDKIKYFFATSDGCQDFVIDNSKKGPREGIYDDVLGDNAFYDNNTPFEPFFDGLIASLNEVSTEEERNNRLKKLIEFGLYQHAGKEKELKTLSDPLLDDDKTFIMFYK